MGTDTVASLAGAILGGLYGEKAALFFDERAEAQATTADGGVIEASSSAGADPQLKEGARLDFPRRWLPVGLVVGLEDGERGKTYALGLAEQLTRKDIPFN